MSLHTNCLYWRPPTGTQSHSLAVNGAEGVRMLDRHYVEYPFSWLRWMQKSPVHSEAAMAARKRLENQPASQWLSEQRTDVLLLPPFLLLSHQRARSLSLLFLARSLYHLWLGLLSAYKLTQTPSLFPLPPILSLFLHATALCSTQDTSHCREKEREGRKEMTKDNRPEEWERERESSLYVVF